MTLVVSVCIAQMLCMPGFTAYSALLPRFRDAWDLTNGQAGLLSGVLFFGYALAVPVLSGLCDRVDARRIYLTGTLIAVGGSTLFATYVDRLAGALIAQLIFGVGFAGIYMPGLKAMTDRVDETLHARAVALYTSLSGVGLACAYAGNSLIADLGGWRCAFAMDAAGVLIAGLIIAATMRTLSPPVRMRGSDLRSTLLQVARNRSTRSFIFGYVVHSWELFGFRAWMVGYLSFTLSKHASGTIGAASLASIVAIVGGVSNIGSSELIKIFGRTRLVIGTMSLSLLLGVSTGLSWVGPTWVVLAMLGVYYGIIMADSAALTSGAIAATPREVRGLMLGVHSMLGFLAGLVSPTLFGAVLDVGGGQQNGWAWTTGFIVLTLPSLAPLVLFSRMEARSAADMGVVGLPFLPARLALTRFIHGGDRGCGVGGYLRAHEGRGGGAIWRWICGS